MLVSNKDNPQHGKSKTPFIEITLSMSLFFTLNYLMIQRTRYFPNRLLSQATELYVKKGGKCIYKGPPLYMKCNQSKPINYSSASNFIWLLLYENENVLNRQIGFQRGRCEDVKLSLNVHYYHNVLLFGTY